MVCRVCRHFCTPITWRGAEEPCPGAVLGLNHPPCMRERLNFSGHVWDMRMEGIRRCLLHPLPASPPWVGAAEGMRAPASTRSLSGGLGWQ